MKQYIIAIGADHRGYFMKEFLKKHIEVDNNHISWIDVGAQNDQRSDYPVFAITACNLILEKKADYGVLLCGTGIGMAMVANKFTGIYAGITWCEEVARLGKEDDNINVLILPTNYVSSSQGYACLASWLNAKFKNGRYQQRITMINELSCYATKIKKM